MRIPPKCLIIISAITGSICSYGALLLIIYAFVETHDTPKMKIIHYFIPIIILGIAGILLLISKKTNDTFFSVISIIMGIILAMVIYMFLCCIVFLIINAFHNLPIYVGYFINVVIPFIICVYGVINVFVTKIDEHKFKIKNFGNKKVRIIHLSDLHLGAIYKKRFSEQIVTKVKQLKPDVVVITGDMCDGTVQIAIEWLTPFDALDVPVLYITGNHEQIHGKEEMLKAVATTKIKYIGNEVFEVCGINFIGVDYEYALKERLKELSSQYKDSPNPNVLLCHIPTMKPAELEEFNIYLFLAGHTHGGQIFPLQLPAYCANACFAGLYSNKSKQNHVYVSTGIGAAVVPMRIGSRSVIGVLVFEGEDSEDTKDDLKEKDIGKQNKLNELVNIVK